MAPLRLPLRDPRTVARDIPGVLDVLFPRLSGALVASLNRRMFSVSAVRAVPEDLLSRCSMSKAMIFEISYARAELMLRGMDDTTWASSLDLAERRQNRHYDAKIPSKMTEVDVAIAEQSASNMIRMITAMHREDPDAILETSPVIPGLGWIASGTGDVAIGRMLIEIKHTDRNFVAADFRQVMLYWLLSYAKAIKGAANVWTDAVLLNPRRATVVKVSFEYLLQTASGNMSRVELFELLRSIVAYDRDRIQH